MKEAAIRAGYNAKSASVIAWQLTNPEINPHVVAAIQEYRAELASKYNTNYERHMRDLQIIRDKALESGAYAAAVQAEYRRGQALGTIYVERKEIRHGTIDSMSKEEVQRKLEELKRLYGGGDPPRALIDAQTGEVIASIDRELDPPFVPPIDIPEDGEEA
jgi:phage terminase small subunit